VLHNQKWHANSNARLLTAATAADLYKLHITTEQTRIICMQISKVYTYACTNKCTVRTFQEIIMSGKSVQVTNILLSCLHQQFTTFKVNGNCLNDLITRSSAKAEKTMLAEHFTVRWLLSITIILSPIYDKPQSE